MKHDLWKHLVVTSTKVVVNAIVFLTELVPLLMVV